MAALSTVLVLRPSLLQTLDRGLRPRVSLWLGWGVLVLLALRILLWGVGFLRRADTSRRTSDRVDTWLPAAQTLRLLPRWVGLAGLLVLALGSWWLGFPHALPFGMLLGMSLWTLFRHDRAMLGLLGATIIVLFMGSYWTRGADSTMKVFDNLDCHIAQTRVLARSGQAFSLDPQARLDEIATGLPLAGVDSGWNVLTWLMMLLPPFPAYAVHELLVRLLAFLGMGLWLSRVWLRRSRPWLQWGSALCFALLPFYPAGGLSIAGVPLVALSFWFLRHRRWSWAVWVPLVVYPFFAKFALAGLFLLAMAGLYWLAAAVRERRLHLPLLGGIALVGLLFLLTQFHLLYTFFFAPFPIFRDELVIRGTPLWGNLKDALANFTGDRTNVMNAQGLVILASAFLGLLLPWRRPDGWRSRTGRKLILLLLFLVATSLLWGLKDWTAVTALHRKWPLLAAFDTTRFFWFNPLVWVLVLGLSLERLRRFPWTRMLPVLLLAGQVLFLFLGYNWSWRTRLNLPNRQSYSLSFSAYYSEPLWQTLKQKMGGDPATFRVVHLGLAPAISQYNGLKTLDVYTDVYPLAYKHRFRRIMAEELAKDPALARVFDENAKRCYLLSAEMDGGSRRSYHFSRGVTAYDPIPDIRHLSLNTSALRELGCRFVLSARAIGNASELELQSLGAFEDPRSPWRVHLYRVQDPQPREPKEPQHEDPLPEGGAQDRS